MSLIWLNVNIFYNLLQIPPSIELLLNRAMVSFPKVVRLLAENMEEALLEQTMPANSEVERQSSLYFRQRCLIPPLLSMRIK